MCNKTIFGWTFAFLGLWGAQAQETGQWFQITSGKYIECCGLAGARVVSLPNERQSFIKLDTSGIPAVMTFFGADRQTVAGVTPCPAGDLIPFHFDGGLVFPDSILFHVDPGPPPSMTYSYVVSNTPTNLRLDGQLGLVQSSCADVPTRFSHSNVVAVAVVTSPVIETVSRTGGQLHFRVVGEPGYDYFVEYNDTWPGGSWLSLTNFRAKLQTVDALILDSIADRSARFYRVRKQDCQCD